MSKRCIYETWGLDHKKPLHTRYNLAVTYKERSLVKDIAQRLDLVIEGYTRISGRKSTGNSNQNDGRYSHQRRDGGGVEGKTREVNIKWRKSEQK